MNEELVNETEAINSIYGEDSLTAGEHDVFVLRLPRHDTSLRISFPIDYPSTPPAVIGVETSGESARKGDAAHILAVFRDILGRLYQPGEVCLFDVIEEVNNVLPGAATTPEIEDQAQSLYNNAPEHVSPTEEQRFLEQEAPWTLSDVVVEQKSVFIARCTPVKSPDQAKAYLQQLLDVDKKVRSATHNITAWRIKGEQNITYQDCDDDGETAAGGRVLHLMQLMDLWDVMVVVTRWYGGHQLGPKRFSIINAVARDAFVQADLVKDDTSTTKKKGKH
ncbi:related to YIH1 Piecemeal microautophagy of the nucleus (PMN) [Rhynchosporium agropyri]|uniref:Related to YIH1 Piecemeal microautophagy of the nucleus (PMN) n=1 Tax=Rhynchosporium agropyri TaxID=914238 RepID=A0A1E1K7S2_9HELO|nr:related to YIH1 Piecemeal microautophagy of the nucleus (PMN) [Rhynchosporium agropyri]